MAAHSAAPLLMQGLVVALGLVTVGIGSILAQDHLRTARRAYQRTASRMTVTFDGWDVWFADGFIGLTLGLQCLVAAGAWVLWAGAGLGLMWLGLSLPGRL